MIELCPMTLKEANAYVEQHHRHHGPVVGHKLDTENGASLRASGWKCVGKAGGFRWTGKRRPEVDLYPAQMKIRFERTVEREAGE